MPHCPACGSRATRIHRRTVDRIRGVIFPSHRYRCTAKACSWEGNMGPKATRLYTILKWAAILIGAVIIGKAIVH